MFYQIFHLNQEYLANRIFESNLKNSVCYY